MSSRDGAAPAGEWRPDLPSVTPAPNRMAAYAAGIALGVAAVALTIMLQEMLTPSIFMLVFLALAGAAWYGGLGPALASIFVSAIGISYYIMEPRYTLAMDTADALRIAVFTGIAILISRIVTAEREPTSAKPLHAPRQRRRAGA